MKTFTIRDFRTRPGQVQEEMRQESEAVLTSNGRPVALIVPVDAGSLDDELAALRNARAVRALADLREQARKSGAYGKKPAEIDALITRTRKARCGEKTVHQISLCLRWLNWYGGRHESEPAISRVWGARGI